MNLTGAKVFPKVGSTFGEVHRLDTDPKSEFATQNTENFAWTMST